MKNCRLTALLVLLLALSLGSADSVSDTLEFLQGFASNFPNALASWTGTDYCTNWTGVTCDENGSVSVELSKSLDASGFLPDANSDDIAVKRINTYGAFVDGPPMTLPDSWSRLKKLEWLALMKAPRISGTLPASWSGMTSAVWLDFDGTSLSGTLPPEWGSLSSLILLYIDSCSIDGTLPAEWSGMTSIKTMHLSQVALSGTLPKEWASMTHMLEFVVSHTPVSGTIPEEYSVFTEVIELYLSNTSISGTLPASWSKFPVLYDLELDSMKLEGPLPEAWGQPGALPKLIYFNLTDNDFCGCEPDSWKNVSILHEAVADMPVALANCTNNACSSKSNSAAAPFFSVWTAALVLLIAVPTSFFL